MNVTCPPTSSACPILLNSKCVIYEGATLVYTNIITNDSVQTALQKIDNIIGNLSAGGLVALAPIGSSPNTQGGTLISGVLTLQPADDTFGGVVSDTTQSFVGAKTFVDELTLSTISHATTDTDTFLVSDGGEIKYRTGTEIRSDIGAGTVNSVAASPGTGINITGSPITTSGTLTITNTAPDQTVVLTQGSGITITGTYPNFTIANSSPSSGGTVTNVSALTLGTSGTDLSSSVANPTTTPVITLNVPTASASNRGVLSPTDWSTFNAKQPAGNYITDLTGEGTASGPGSVTLTLDNSAVINKVLTGLSVTGTTIIATDTILQAFGKTQNQINALIGGVNYQGTWNANTNSPTLVSSTGTKGYYYVVNVAGSTNLNGITDWKLGDWVIFNGSVWEKVDNTDAVISVNGQTGIVSLSLASSDFANQGTATTVLHGNAAGNPSWGQVVDADIANSTISNSKLANSTISGISLGSNLATLTIGTHLTGTSYNGSTGVTIATDATTANTANTIVARDASGNVTVGGLIATSLNSNTWNAGSGTSVAIRGAASQTIADFSTTAASVAGTFTISGLSSGSAGNFVVDGGSGLLVTRTAAQVLGDIGASSTAFTLTFGTHLTSGGSSYNGSANVTISTDATDSNTASTIVARNASGNITVGGLIATSLNANTWNAGSGTALALRGSASQVIADFSTSAASIATLSSNGLVTTSGGTGALSVTVPGTGVLTALSVNVGSAGAFVVNGGALGTPSSGVATNLTGTAAGLSIGGNAATATSATSATNTTNVGVTDDNSTNATMYPTWVTANTGNLPIKVSSSFLTFNPSLSLLTVGTSASTSGAPTPDRLWVREDNTGDNVVTAAIRTTKTGTASTSTVTGLNVWTSTSHTSGTIGNINSIRGYFNNTSNTAAITTARGVAAIAEINGSGAISSLRLFDASSFNGGSSVITNGYGFYMDAWPTTGITVTNKYGVYINDANADNYFAGTGNFGSTLSLSKAAGNAIIQTTDASSSLLLQTSTTLSGPAVLGVGNSASVNGGCLAFRYGDSSASVATMNARTNGVNWSVSMYSSDFPIGNLRRFALMGTDGYLLLKNYDSGAVSYATERLEVDGNIKLSGNIILGSTTVTSTGTQLNYLNAATGTTGTTSSNLVFSASPTLTGTITMGKIAASISASNHDISSSTSGSQTLSVTNSSGNPYGINIVFSTTDPNGTGNHFIDGTANGTLRFEMRSNGGLANFSANNVNLSDVSVKKDITPSPPLWDKIKAIEIVDYLYEEENDDAPKKKGTTAQSVEAVAPEWVTEFGEKEDGTPLKGVYEMQMFYGIFKTVQEMQSRIEDLETQLKKFTN